MQFYKEALRTTYVEWHPAPGRGGEAPRPSLGHRFPVGVLIGKIRPKAGIPDGPPKVRIPSPHPEAILPSRRTGLQATDPGAIKLKVLFARVDSPCPPRHGEFGMTEAHPRLYAPNASSLAPRRWRRFLMARQKSLVGAMDSRPDRSACG